MSWLFHFKRFGPEGCENRAKELKANIEKTLDQAKELQNGTSSLPNSDPSSKKWATAVQPSSEQSTSHINLTINPPEMNAATGLSTNSSNIPRDTLHESLKESQEYAAALTVNPPEMTNLKDANFP